MEDYVNITEATKRLGKSDRQVRRMVHSGKLRYRYMERKLEIAVADIDKLARHVEPTNISERLDALERQTALLRQELDILSRRIKEFTDTKEEIPQKPIVARLVTSDAGMLPDGLVVASIFCTQHGIPDTTIRNAMKSGRFHAKEGNWIVGRTTAKHALDAAGRSQFWQLYHNREDFQPCAECPHSAQINGD